MIKLKVNLTVFVVSCLFVNPVQPRTQLYSWPRDIGARSGIVLGFPG